MRKFTIKLYILAELLNDKSYILNFHDKSKPSEGKRTFVGYDKCDKLNIAMDLSLSEFSYPTKTKLSLLLHQ